MSGTSCRPSGRPRRSSRTRPLIDYRPIMLRTVWPCIARGAFAASVPLLNLVGPQGLFRLHQQVPAESDRTRFVPLRPVRPRQDSAGTRRTAAAGRPGLAPAECRPRLHPRHKRGLRGHGDDGRRLAVVSEKQRVEASADPHGAGLPDAPGGGQADHLSVCVCEFALQLLHFASSPTSRPSATGLNVWP